MDEKTIEICAICGQPKKKLVLLNNTVPYCPCDDKPKVPAQAGNAPTKQLDLFPDPYDWSDISKSFQSPWNNKKP